MKNKFLLLILLLSNTCLIDAQTWDSVSTGIGGGINYGRIFALCTYNSGLYAAGSFSFAGGNSTKSIARWNGTNWAPLGTEDLSGTRALTVYNNELYAGGSFMGIPDGTTQHIAKWDGSDWYTSGTLPETVVALGVYNNSIYASQLINLDDRYIYKLEGSSWTYNNSGTDNAVNAFAVYNNELYAGGNFLTAGGDSVRRIAKWNDVSWSAVGEGLNQVVWCLTIHNGELYAGGNFSSRVSKWDGINWTAIGNGFNADVRTLCSFNGILYAGGYFTTAGGTPANYIAQWDGTSWSALGDGVDSTVFALCVYDSVLYAGGLFSHAGGISANRIARWNPLDIGIDENDNKVGVTVFPNPFSAATTLTLNKEIKNVTLTVYSIQGKEVRSTKFNGKNVVLQQEDLAGGIYFYKITSPNEVIATGKLIIQ